MTGESDGHRIVRCNNLLNEDVQMRRIDWSPLVVLLAAPMAMFLASLLPESFFLSERVSSIIIWVLLTMIVLRIIREIRIRRIMKNPMKSTQLRKELER